MFPLLGLLGFVVFARRTSLIVTVAIYTNGDKAFQAGYCSRRAWERVFMCGDSIQHEAHEP